jgi:hypothetical protein
MKMQSETYWLYQQIDKAAVEDYVFWRDQNGWFRTEMLKEEK